MAIFATYDPGDFYDELIDSGGQPRTGARLLVDKIESLPPGDLAMRQKAAEALLLKMGITFTVATKVWRRFSPSTSFPASFPPTTGSRSKAG